MPASKKNNSNATSAGRTPKRGASTPGGKSAPTASRSGRAKPKAR